MKLLLFVPVLLFACSSGEVKKPKPAAPEAVLTYRIAAAEKDEIVKDSYSRFGFRFERRNSYSEVAKIPVTFELACNGVLYTIPESDLVQQKEITVSPGVYSFRVTSDFTTEPLVIDSVSIRCGMHQSIDVILDYDPAKQTTQHP
jgi:hypothetical protein